MIDPAKSIRVVLTPHDLCEIVSRSSGQKVTLTTHWIAASVELPPELPPLGIAVTATRR